MRFSLLCFCIISQNEYKFFPWEQRSDIFCETNCCYTKETLPGKTEKRKSSDPPFSTFIPSKKDPFLNPFFASHSKNKNKNFTLFILNTRLCFLLPYAALKGEGKTTPPRSKMTHFFLDDAKEEADAENWRIWTCRKYPNILQSMDINLDLNLSKTVYA